VPYLSRGSDDGCTVLVLDAVVKALQEEVSHAQQSVLFQVVEWIRPQRLILDKHTHKQHVNNID
jgi:hypothetical protein